jgi:cytochrome c553
MLKRNASLGVALLCIALVSGATSADGKAKAMACGACHGADGNSSNPIWPNLAGQHAGYLLKQAQAFKTGSRQNPSMAPMVINLPDEDLVEIADFFAAQTPRIATIDAATAAAGQKLYRGGDAVRGIPACMACHGPNGAGNPAANYPALRGQQPEYTVLQLKAYRDGTRATDPQSMMRQIAKSLSDEEMQNLAKFISALH